MSLFRSIFKYVWPSMRKYKFLFYGSFLLFGIRALLENVIKPIFFKRIIDNLSSSVDEMNRLLLEPTLLNLVLIIVIINFSLTLISRLGKFMIYDFEIKVIKELRNFSFSKITNNSQTFFANTFAGSLVTKSNRFVRSFETMFDILIYQFYGTLIAFIGMFFVLYNQSKQACVVFSLFVFIYILIIILFLKTKIIYDADESTSDSKLSGRLSDVFGNMLAVKIFSAKKNEKEKFREITTQAETKSKKAWFFGGKIEIAQALFGSITLSLLLYLLIKLWLKGQISTGTVVLIQTYMITIYEKLWDLSNAMMKFTKSAAEMKEVVEIFETVPDIEDPKNPEKLNMTKGHLVFNNVSFSYKNGQEVFSNFSIDIAPGERIGLVGHSGAGKSTFTNLILRFSDVSAGGVTIDGQDIRNVTQDDLRSVISYVPQESILFHRTIRENIAYGKDNATDEDVIEVAKKAYAHDFIEKLPYKYETYVGERGVKLSGGERQRVAIARAMIKDAPILILDEATSSLDSVSETYIQKAFDELMKNKTTIVIAHRLSTISKMDRIIVLEDGKITEQGTHADLIARGGDYADLWNHQVGGFIE